MGGLPFSEERGERRIKVEEEREERREVEEGREERREERGV